MSSTAANPAVSPLLRRGLRPDASMIAGVGPVPPAVIPWARTTLVRALRRLTFTPPIDVPMNFASAEMARTITFVVPAWNDALLFVEREGMKEAHQLGIWLSLYGVPETTAAPLRQGLADLQSALSVAPA